jgi:hypothetical protein
MTLIMFLLKKEIFSRQNDFSLENALKAMKEARERKE